MCWNVPNCQTAWQPHVQPHGQHFGGDSPTQQYAGECGRSGRKVGRSRHDPRAIVMKGGIVSCTSLSRRCPDPLLGRGEVPARGQGLIASCRRARGMLGCLTASKLSRTYRGLLWVTRHYPGEVGRLKVSVSVIALLLIYHCLFCSTPPRCSHRNATPRN